MSHVTRPAPDGTLADRGTTVPAERRRPGPRTDVHARALILDAAEELFAASGPEAVSLRAVARHAGVAPAAVSYHFASRAGLVEAVHGRRAATVAARVRDNLLALPPDGVTPRDLVEAVLRPYVDLVSDDPVGGLRWIKTTVHLALERSPLWVRSVERDVPLGRLFLERAERVLPDPGSDAVRRRIGIAMYTLLTALASADGAAYGGAGPDGFDPEFVEQLVVFTAAGLAGGDA